MPGLGDLFGKNGVIEQLLLWQVAGQMIGALGGPALTALTQDANARHPELALMPDVAAQAVARHLLGDKEAAREAARAGIDAGRFTTLVELARVHLSPDVLAQAVVRHIMTTGEAERQARPQGITAEQFGVMRELAKVRLPPADLAEAVLRSYMPRDEAEGEARPQGVTPKQLGILADLAGNAPGADQLISALLRGIIPAGGHGAQSTSYEQGIAEGRLHNKWGPVLRKLSTAVLAPPDAAAAVVRNFLTQHDGEQDAAKSGVDRELFTVMRHLAADAPGPQQLAEALRRKAIKRDGRGPQSTSFEQGIAEGRLADKWSPVIEALAKLWPTPVDALDARLKGQITPEEGKRLYELLGGDPQFYTWLLNSRGSAPTPLEAIQMANRGIIPWKGTGPQSVSYQQAFLEGPWRDKWEEPYRKLGDYVPPPETVRTLLEQGSIGKDEAVNLWHKAGLDQGTVSAYLEAAAFNNTAQVRGLSIGAVLDMFYGQMIDEKRAHELLALFHLPKENANLMLAYTMMRRSIASMTSAVNRIRSLLVARKIGTQTATESLRRLKIPDVTAAELLSTWELEASVNVKTLTESQIVDAFAGGIISRDEAMTELEAIGYTAYDAWILLSVKSKTKLPNKPPRTVARPLGSVIPGVT
jgi:hypothetical protein